MVPVAHGRNGVLDWCPIELVCDQALAGVRTRARNDGADPPRTGRKPVKARAVGSLAIA